MEINEDNCSVKKNYQSKVHYNMLLSSKFGLGTTAPTLRTPWS